MAARFAAVAAVASHFFQDHGWLRSFAGREGWSMPQVCRYHGLLIRRSTISANWICRKKLFLNGGPASQLCFGHRVQKVWSLSRQIQCGILYLSRNSPRTVSSYWRPVKWSNILLLSKTKTGTDVIVIDGTGESRAACSRIAITNLRPGGLIILDNSDLWLTSSQIITRDSGLIQVDFTGFAPMNAHCHTTSVYFSRDFNFVPLRRHQPHKSIAQPADPWPDA